MHGDCVEAMAALDADSIDAVCCDPPYGIAFMAKTWDVAGIAFDPDTWRAALRVLKPGGHLLAFGGTRTYHRLACAIEDAGFDIRDSILWLYGSGFPKSLDVSKAIDKAAGIDRERWQGWGTALKPAHEPIVVARKPLIGTVVDNVLAHGTGALNIDGCRIESGGVTGSSDSAGAGQGYGVTASMNPEHIYTGALGGGSGRGSSKWPLARQRHALPRRGMRRSGQPGGAERRRWATLQGSGWRGAG